MSVYALLLPRQKKARLFTFTLFRPLINDGFFNGHTFSCPHSVFPCGQKSHFTSLFATPSPPEKKKEENPRMHAQASSRFYTNSDLLATFFFFSCNLVERRKRGGNLGRKPAKNLKDLPSLLLLFSSSAGFRSNNCSFELRKRQTHPFLPPLFHPRATRTSSYPHEKYIRSSNPLRIFFFVCGLYVHQTEGVSHHKCVASSFFSFFSFLLPGVPKQKSAHLQKKYEMEQNTSLLVHYQFHFFGICVKTRNIDGPTP